MRYAELRPDLPPSIFPSLPLLENRDRRPSRLVPVNKEAGVTSPSTIQGDERLYDDGVADEDMFEAGMPLCTVILAVSSADLSLSSHPAGLH